MDLLLVGGGHAMLQTLCAAGAWPIEGLRVTLVNTGRYLYYSGMIPEFLGGVYEADDVRIDLQRLCERSGVHFIDACITELDRRKRIVTARDGRAFSYDIAAFDVGGVNPGRPEPAVPTKPLDRVHELEERLRDTLAGSPRRLRLVIAGGGAAGVEVTLNISGRFAGRGRSRDLECTIVEPAPRILASFPRGMSRRVLKLLTERGVEVVTHSGLQWNGDGQPALDDGTLLPADEVLWATGTVGLSLFQDAGLTCDGSGFVRVAPSLRTVDDARLFAAGDCAAPDGMAHLRKVGVHAIKQGETLRENLRRTVEAVAAGRESEHADLAPFKPYPVAPLILSTGTDEGLWTAGPLWLRGGLMLRLKHFIDRRWIRRYQRTGFADASLADLIGAEAPC